MKHFRIAVNGTSYDVEVTELDGAVSAAAALSLPRRSCPCARCGSRRSCPCAQGRRPRW